MGSGVGHDNDITRYSAVAVAQPTFDLLPGFVLFKGQAGFLDKLTGEGGGIVVDDPVFVLSFVNRTVDYRRSSAAAFSSRLKISSTCWSNRRGSRNRPVRRC